MSRRVSGYFDLTKMFLLNVFDAIKCYRLIKKMDGPIATIFGGKYAEENEVYTKKAFELGQKLVEHGISVITGGGPGIMQGANLGASTRKDGLWSVGVIVKGMPEKLNNCSQAHLVVNSLYSRKWMLMFNSEVHIFFPGGYGTLDEFFDIELYHQIKYLKGSSIVLIGKDYWQPLLDWVNEFVYKRKLVAADEIPEFLLTDDINEVVELLKKKVLKINV